MGVEYTRPPQSRNEAILDSIVEGIQYTDPPQSRIEDLLLQVKEVIEEGGHDESATRASIAPTESDSAHASKNIAVDEQFYLSDDKLYTATSPISQGSAIIVYPTSGYNCKLSDSVTGQIKSNKDNIDNIYINIGLKPTPVSAVVANNLQPRFKDITSDFYLGTLRAEIAAGDFSNIRAGDYIIGQTTGSKYFVACLDWMLNKGDQTGAAYVEQAYGTHHLGLMLEKAGSGVTRMWAGRWNAGATSNPSSNDRNRCPWNASTSVDPTSSTAEGSNDTNITRTYSGASVSGYMGSFIRERMDAILLPVFQSDFGSANVLKFRNLNGNAVVTDKPSGGQGNWNGCTSGWAWYDRYLDLPSEVEVYGSRVFGSAMDIGVQCEQLPMFKNGNINKFFPRFDFWTKAVASSSNAASRSSDGIANRNVASIANWACPLACIK